MSAEEDFRRPVTLALTGVALIGWVLAAFLWSQASRIQDEMTASLHAAEKARESLAADLQNLQKSAGTAADLKVRWAEAEKALSEASAARASAQNELADITKQINDAKLAISGAQEEASAKSRELQSVDARLKEETDRLAALQSQNQEVATEQTRLQGQAVAARTALAEAQNQTAAAQTYVIGILRYPGFYQAPRAVVSSQELAIRQWLAGQDPAGRRLGTIRLPTLVADGTEDQLNPVANDRTLARSVPGTKLILYPGAGHAFLFQDMASFLPAVTRFLGR